MRTNNTANGNANGKLMQIDLDTKDPIKLQETRVILQKTGVLERIIFTVETKNGYHIIYKKSDAIDNKALHEHKLSTTVKKTARNGDTTIDYLFSITNQPLVVVPGTYQGGFQARFANVFNK